MESQLVRRDQFNISPQGIVTSRPMRPLPHLPVIPCRAPCVWVRSATNNPMGTAIAPMTLSG
jgi:hypothetical protein